MYIREATPADAASIARVHVASWQTSYRGIVADEYLDNLSHEKAVERWTRILQPVGGLGFTYVAETEDGTLAGFANGGAERGGDPVYKGELYAIYLLAEHQRGGLGRRLMFSVVDKLLEMNLDSMLVWVLAANPARRFYESLGAEPVRETQLEIGGASFVNVAYGWKDIRALASANR